MEELTDAVAGLAEQLITMAYRANVMEQTTLRLLAHLAKLDNGAAQKIALEVKEQVLEMGNRRDNPLEAAPQEGMLELLNYVQKAAGRSDLEASMRDTGFPHAGKFLFFMY